jgi:hypothetical protein
MLNAVIVSLASPSSLPPSPADSGVSVSDLELTEDAKSKYRGKNLELDLLSAN